MSVFEDILDNLDLNQEIYKILGLPDPEKYPESEPLGKLSDYPTVYWENFTTWCKGNQILLAIIGLGLVIVLVSFRR